MNSVRYADANDERQGHDVCGIERHIKQAHQAGRRQSGTRRREQLAGGAEGTDG